MFEITYEMLAITYCSEKWLLGDYRPIIELTQNKSLLLLINTL